VDVRVTADAAANAQLVAGLVARRLTSAVRRRGRASLAVSGGSTPRAMFDVLARADVPWEAVHLLQVDERVAPDGDPDRNAVDLVAHLAGPLGIPSSRLHLMPVTSPDLRRAATRYGALVGGLAPLDVVHLGVGDDGHTASWPPGDPVVRSARPVEAIGEFNGRRRMTLTPQVVNGARSRVVEVVGAAKQPVVERWLHGDRSLPISHVRRTSTILVVDRAAAPVGT